MLGKIGADAIDTTTSVADFWKGPNLLPEWDHFFRNASSDQILQLRNTVRRNEHLFENLSGWDTDKVLEDWQNAAQDVEMRKKDLADAEKDLETRKSLLRIEFDLCVSQKLGL